jgi:hypothetical protein
MDLARRGNLHSLHYEVLQHLVETRAMLGPRDLSLRDHKALMNFGKAAVDISEVTARVLRIGKALCRTHPAVMSLQHLEEITLPNVTSQVLLPIYLPESHLHPGTTLAQIL